MPTLFRLVMILGVLSGLTYGVMVLLATLVEPQPREIVETVPIEQLIQQP